MNYQLKINNLVIVLIILGLVLPSFAFIRSESILPPETPEEAREMGEKALETTKEELPGILERIWKEEMLPVWQGMWTWTKNYWKETLWPRIAELCSSLAQRFTQAIKGFWERRVESPVKREMEIKKEAIEERTKEEKKEIQEKLIPETTKSLWEWFKKLWK